MINNSELVICSDIEESQEALIIIHLTDNKGEIVSLNINANVNISRIELQDISKWYDNNMFDTILKKVAEHIND